MNIYDETIEKLKGFGEIEVHEDDGVIEEYWLIGETEPIKNAIKTLERAKKVEELLEVYKGIDGGGSPDGLNKLYKLRDNLEKELEEMK